MVSEQFTNVFQGFGNNFEELAGGKVYVTDRDTGDPITTWSDFEKTVPNAHPVILSASGKAVIILDDGAVNIELTNSLDATIWTLNNYDVSTDTITEPVLQDFFTAIQQACLTSEENASDSSDNTDTNAALTAADVVTTNADVVTTNADVVTTNADVVLTGADVDATNADVVSTNADAVSTAADAATTTSDRAAVEDLYDTFDDRYLGTKSSDPTLDNDGNALLTGAIYFNDVVNHTRFYNGAAWEDPEETATSGAATATTKAAEASASAAEAAISETNAETAETNAQTAETNAETAQTAAETAETNAETAETNAETAQGLAETAQANAETAETNAETAQTAAETAETNAETAQTAAELAETNAETAETNAETAETNAETAETNATTSASAAATSAAEAAASAALADGNIIVKLSSVAYGYTKKVDKADRWLETDTPNVIVDKLGDDARFGDGLVSRNTELDNHTATSTDASSSIYQTDDTSMFSVDDAVQIVNYETSEIETKGIITAISTDVSITLGDADTYNRVSGTKYIAKELPQAEFDLAPFASGSTDELLDAAVNGATTQSDHGVGDFIVTGNELATNGDFDTDFTGWTESDETALFTVTAGVAKIDRNNGTGKITSSALGLITGVEYTITIDAISFGVPSTDIVRVNFDGTPYDFTTVGTHIITATATNTTGGITIQASGSVISVIEFDNVSVVAKNTIYQNIASSTANDLLTDTEKFQVLTRVTTQDILRDTTTGYDAIRGLNLFAAGVSNDTIASTTNYSKLGNGLYHDGTQEVTISALRTTLNGLAYHPIYSAQGCRQFSDNKDWYETTDTVTSVYDCHANRSSSTTSGRPDGKVENIVYYEQLIFKPTYSQQANEHDLLAESIDLGMAEYTGVETLIRNQELASATQTTVAVLNSEPEPVIGGSIYHNSLARRIESYVDDDTNWVMTLNSSMAIVVDTDIYYTTKANHNLTQGTALSVKAVCDPQYLPSDWLSYLAGGNSVDIDFALVNVNDGTSMLPDGVIDDFLMPTKILSASTGGDLIYDNSAGTWGAGTTDIATNVDNIITSTNLPADDVSLSSYTSQNEPFSQSDPMPVKLVQPKTIATNSHSIYKGAMLTKCVTGKVAVGNGVRGLESKVLENAEFYSGSYDGEIEVGVNIIVKHGDVVKVVDDSFDDASYGEYYQRNGSDISFTPLASGTGFQNPTFWESLQTTPEHTPITLDEEDSPSCKVFKTLAVDPDNNEYCIQPMGKEVIFDVDYGDTGEFEQLTNGVIDDDNANSVRTYVGMQRTGVFKND